MKTTIEWTFIEFFLKFGANYDYFLKSGVIF